MGFQGTPAWASLCECLEYNWNLACHCCPMAAGSGRPGQEEGESEAQGSGPEVDPDSLISLRCSRDLPNGDRALVPSWEKTQLNFLPNTEWTYNLSSKPEQNQRGALAIYHGNVNKPEEIGYMVTLPWSKLDGYANGLTGKKAGFHYSWIKHAQFPG